MSALNDWVEKNNADGNYAGWSMDRDTGMPIPNIK